MALLMCSNFKKYEPIVVCGGESLKKAFDDKGIDTYALSFGKKDLLKTLKNLKSLIKGKNIEIIISDNASTDNTRLIVNKLIDLFVKFP